MRRKIFICFFVVFLMTTLVVPAFASSPSSAGGSTYFAVFDFDYIDFTTATDAIYFDWPHNTGQVNTSSDYSSDYLTFFESSDDAFKFACYSQNTNFITDIYCYDARNALLYSDDLVFSADQAEFLRLDFNIGGYRAENIKISGFCCYVEEINGQYTLVRQPFSLTLDGQYLSLPLKTVLEKCSLRSNGSLYYFQDFQMQFDLTRLVDDPDNENYLPSSYYFRVTVPAVGARYEVDNWFAYLDLTHTTVQYSDVNFFDWLLDSVNAFLNFELFPGFSINRLMQVILIIGLLFWFLKVVV